MTEELKVRVLSLESQLQRKDGELQAKTASFQEALAREQERSAQREAKDTAKRGELSAKLAKLQDDEVKLRSQLAELQDAKAEAERWERELKASRRELAEVRAKGQEERRELEEQLADRRRAQERHRQEVSDLRCHISVLEHRLQHANGKLGAQDTQTEELAKLREELRAAKDSRDGAERAHKTEAARFSKERKAADERLEAALSELRELKHGPSRVELCATYEEKIDTLADVAREACAMCSRPGGPQLPADPTDVHAMREHIEALKALSPSSPVRASKQPTPTKSRSHTSRGDASPASNVTPPPERQDDDLFGAHAGSEMLCDEARDALIDMRACLEGLIVEKQVLLGRRFRDSARANVDADGAGGASSTTASPSRGFGVTSGFPSVRDEPATLVNHIALVTNDRDRMSAKADHLARHAADLESQLTTATRERDEARADAPPASAPASPQRHVVKPASNTTSPKKEETAPAAAAPTEQPQQKPAPASKRNNPPPLLSSRRQAVGAGSR